MKDNSLAEIQQLCKLSLRELRHRQALNDQMIQEAYKRRNAKALKELRRREGQYMVAVDRKCFTNV
jgi:hypothetical protein